MARPAAWKTSSPGGPFILHLVILYLVSCCTYLNCVTLHPAGQVRRSGKALIASHPQNPAQPRTLRYVFIFLLSDDRKTERQFRGEVVRRQQPYGRLSNQPRAVTNVELCQQ